MPWLDFFGEELVLMSSLVLNTLKWWNICHFSFPVPWIKPGVISTDCGMHIKEKQGKKVNFEKMVSCLSKDFFVWEKKRDKCKQVI